MLSIDVVNNMSKKIIKKLSFLRLREKEKEEEMQYGWRFSLKFLSI